MNRRTFLGATAGALAAADTAKKTVAAIVTAYYPRSHADVICSRIFEGYSPEGVRTEPRTRIISMYTDQVAQKDMSRDVSAKYGFKIWPTIAEALTLGTGKLAVDAVLFIGEHGNYATNDRGQKIFAALCRRRAPPRLPKYAAMLPPDPATKPKKGDRPHSRICSNA